MKIHTNLDELFNDPEYFSEEDKIEIENEVSKIGKSEFSIYLAEQLKDPEFKKEWDALQPERDAIRAEIDAKAHGTDWRSFRDQMYTPQEIAESELRISAMEETK